MTPSIQPMGDTAAIVRWPASDETFTVRSIRQFSAELTLSLSAAAEGDILSVVPAFDSVTIHFCPGRISFDEVAGRLESALQELEHRPEPLPTEVEISVCFDEDFAPDLPELARTREMPCDDFIHLFCEATYSVRMIGFSPGFPYLSGLPEQLLTPRRNSPRLKVPAGSVAIGGSQAGIYPQETPGGWNLIGRTPLTLFSAERAEPCLLSAGDLVKFTRISMEEFQMRRGER